MSGVDAALARIEALIRRHLRTVAPFRAVVTAVDGGLIEIRRAGATTADERPYASIARASIVVGDEVLCANLNGEPVVLDRINRVAAATPTFAAQAGAGSTASTASSFGSDEHGMIQLVPGGTGITTGAQVVVTFAAARPDANYEVRIQPLSSAARALGQIVGPTSRSTGGWTLTTATALTSGSTYQWGYKVEQFP